MKPQYLLFAVPLLTLLGAQVKADSLPLEPDNTLGAESSIVTPLSPTQELVEGGAARGANLFHSFSEFNVNTGTSVYFTNPSSIENILTRVTGYNPSAILGTLGVFGNANLFLLNPNGLLFGENAQLDIKGSFVASTANSIDFGNGNHYSATNPDNSTLVSVQPGALFHNAVANQTLTNQGNLAVGGNLTLDATHLNLQGQLQAGGNLTLQATDTVQIRDRATHPFIARAGENLLVEGNQTVDIFALNHPSSGFSAERNIQLRSANPVIGDANYAAGGNFTIEQMNGSLGNLLSPNDPIIRAGGNVSFNDYTGASLHIFAGGSVTINGTVTMTGADPTNGINQNITLSNGIPLAINGRTQPTLDIRAGTTNFGIAPACTGCPPTPTALTLGAGATSADITINQINFEDTVAASRGLVFLSNQWNPNNTLTGGDIQVGTITTQNSTGETGSIAIDSRAGIALSGNINASSSGLAANGNGGVVGLLAQNDISTQSINTSSANRTGGNLAINSVNGGVQINGNINASTSGTIPQAIGGAVGIFARNNIATQAINTFSANRAGGQVQINSSNGGLQINGDIDTRALSSTTITNGGRVTLSGQNDILTQAINTSSGNGAGGQVQLTSSGGGLQVNGDINTRAFSSTTFTNAGNVTLTGQNNIVTRSIDTRSGRLDGGTIQITSTNGNIEAGDMNSSGGLNGGGGNISISATNGDALLNGSAIDSSSNGSNAPGIIAVNANRVRITNSSTLIANTNGTGNATRFDPMGRPIARIDITGGSLIEIDNSRLASIGTSTSSGTAGFISIASNSRLSITNDSTITSSNQGSNNSGNIFIRGANILTVDDSTISSDVSNGTSGGLRGIITLRGNSVSLQNGTIVSSETSGQAAAGRIQLEADQDLLSITNANISSNSSGIGDAGDIIFRFRNSNGSLSIADSTIRSDSSLGSTASSRGAVTTDSQNRPQNIDLSNATLSSSTSGQAQAGTVNLEATNAVTVVNDSQILSTVNPGIGGGNAGNVTLRGDTVTLDNSTASSEVKAGGVGNGQNVNITARTILLNNGAQATSNTSGTGNAGNVFLNGDTVTLDNNSIASSEVKAGGVGSGQNVNITARTILLNNGAQATSNTSGTGNAGNVFLNGDTVTLDNNSIASSEVKAGGVGSGQNVNITARTIRLNNGAQATSNTSGTGNAGNVFLDGDTVTLDNNSIASSEVKAGGVGNGQNVNITARTILLNNGAQATSSTSGTGDAGNVTLTGDEVTLNSSTATSAVIQGGQGDGGDVNITSRILDLINSEATSSTFSNTVSNPSEQNNAGNVQLRSTERMTLNSSTASSAVGSMAKGDGGNVTLEAPTIDLNNGSQASSNTAGVGNAGNVTLNGDTVTLDNNSTASSEVRAGGVGNGQTVNITARTILLNNGAQATSSTSGTGNAGEVNLNGDTVTLNNSAASSNTAGVGNAGNVNLTATASLKLDNSSASSAVESTGRGEGGSVTLNAPDIQLNNNSEASSNTAGVGNAGNVNLTATASLKLDNSSASSAVESTGRGEGGSVILRAPNIQLNNNSEASSNTAGVGNAGSVRLDGNIVTLNNSSASSAVKAGGQGNGRNVDITGRIVSLNNGAEATSNTAGNGSAGNVELKARERLDINNSTVSSEVERTGQGAGGNVIVEAPSVTLNNGSLASSSTAGVGNAGIVTLSGGTVMLENSTVSSAVNEGGRGDGRDVNIVGRTVTLSNGSRATSSTAGVGNAGNVNLGASDRLSLERSTASSAVEKTGVGQGGNVILTAPEVTLSNNAEASSSTAGAGNAGNVNLSGDRITFDNSTASSAVNAGGNGNGKNVEVRAQTLSLVNGASISSSTFGRGDAGNVKLTIADTLTLNNSSASSAVGVTGIGQGGNVEIATRLLSLANNAFLSASTRGQGDAGSVNLTARERADFNNSLARSSVRSGAVGQGGNVIIQTPLLSLTNGAQLSSSTEGMGNAGNVTATVRDSIALDNSTISSAVDSGGVGRGGNINLNTQQLSLDNNSSLLASTRGQGNAGNANIIASNSVALNASAIKSAVEFGATGSGGNITINTPRLSLTNGAEISGSTAGNGSTGFIAISAGEQTTLSDSRISSTVAATATGDSRGIQINTGALTLNRAQITSNSEGRGRAGDIDINVDSTFLSRGGEITATSSRSGGGDITIRAENTLLTQSSLISTSVFDGTGGGGNIEIFSPTFIALEDSDILANAFRGDGGNIVINSVIFLADLFSNSKAFAVGRNPGDFQRFRGNGRVDISASSAGGIGGSVNFPDFTFLQNSLQQLATNFIDTETAISNSCIARRNAQRGTFYITGTGGIPYNPYDSIRGQYEVTAVRGLRGEGSAVALMNSATGQEPSVWKLGDPVVEAGGLVATADGRLVLGTSAQIQEIAQANEEICYSESETEQHQSE